MDNTSYTQESIMTRFYLQTYNYVLKEWSKNDSTNVFFESVHNLLYSWVLDLVLDLAIKVTSFQKLIPDKL